MKTIQIKEVQNITNVFDVNSYDSSGIYNVNNTDIVFVNKASKIVNFVCVPFDLEQIEEVSVSAEQTSDSKSVSEDFALKAMLIASKQCKTLTVDEIFKK